MNLQWVIFFLLVKGMVHLTLDMASDDDVWAPWVEWWWSDSHFVQKKTFRLHTFCVKNLVPPTRFYICNWTERYCDPTEPHNNLTPPQVFTNYSCDLQTFCTVCKRPIQWKLDSFDFSKTWNLLFKINICSGSGRPRILFFFLNKKCK